MELSIVVPTFNERENVDELIARLAAVLEGIEWEVVFVDDDSSDGTADYVRGIARSNRRVRVLQRIGRRGLSSACVEGILSTAAPYVAVMDADLQHDETLLPRMLETLKEGGVDIVVGSRYMGGGEVGDFSRARAEISGLATRLSRLVLRAELTDPMSGFFMVRREAFDRSVRGLTAIGYKILLDLFASAPKPLAYRELPYRFRPRRRGQSKLDTLVALEYGLLLLDKWIGRLVPARFVLFAAVGGLGLLLHVGVLALALDAGLRFSRAQAAATGMTIAFNFLLNNALTYRDRRLRGGRLVKGLLSFYLVCSVGALANVGVATAVFGAGERWWLAGAAGALVGGAWNYAASSFYTWNARGS